MSTEVRQPTRLSLSIGSTDQKAEFQFSKVTIGLERDLASMENPLDAYRDINALLQKALGEIKLAPLKPVTMPKAEAAKASACKYCGAEILWGQPYKAGSGPNNPDGSPHRCRNP